MTRGGSIAAALLANRAKTPVTQESRAVDARTRFQTRIVGALPVITYDFERLDLAATIDGLVPWQGDVPRAPSSRSSSPTACSSPRPSSASASGPRPPR